MLVVHIFVGAAALFALFWAVYLLTLPLLAAVRKSATQENPGPLRNPTPRVSVVIPAHNMELYIERCVNSLAACDFPRDKLHIYVIADHCSDQTAVLAPAAGANVLVREAKPPGKTFALAWAFGELRAMGVDSDLYVIIDATAYVATDFLAKLAQRWTGGEDVIMAHTLVDPANQKWFARCLGQTLAHRNLQDWSRERLYLSALVCGRGMAFGRNYIDKHGWSLAAPPESDSGAHPTEDFRHGVQLAEHGYRVAFANDAYVYTPLRQSLRAATKQNIRWERGRIGNAFTHARQLLYRSIRQRDLRKFIAAFDAIQPPVAVVIGLSALLILVAMLFVESTLLIFFYSLPFLLSFAYGLLVLRQGQDEGIPIRAAIWAPIYIAWRLSSFVSALTRMDRLVAKRTGRTLP